MQDWIEVEMENQDMGDARLNKRLANMIGTLSVEPSKSIPCANDTWSETLAAYRFFDNEKVSFDSIMTGHKAATLNRIQREPVVLIPQDTTFLNFATDSKSKEMGTLRTKDSNQQLLHTSIAITPSRVNLGVVNGSMWQRPEKKAGNTRYTKPLEEKESRRWLDHYKSACTVQSAAQNTTIVSIADREGDIHEWFQYAETVPEQSRASYIIRAKANRTIELEDGDTIALWDYMTSLKKLGQYRVNVPKRNGEPGRDAHVNVSASEVRLLGKGKTRKPLSLYVVYAKESHPPEGQKGIEWMLARRQPDRPCTDVYSEREWTILWRMRMKTAVPKDIPSVRDMTRMLAGMGGFLGRKGDGEPGVKTVWEGYDKLLHYIEAAETLGL